MDADAVSGLTNPILRYLDHREVWSPCELLEWKEKYSVLSSLFHRIPTSAAARFNRELQLTLKSHALALQQQFLH